MLSRKRMLRLAAKCGPFVRFFPGGSEGSDSEEKPEGLSDEEAAAAAIEEAEPKVEDTAQFKGLLRDHQATRTSLNQVNAENMAYKVENERLQKQVESGKKDEVTLTEEEAGEEVNRGQLHTFGKNIVKNVMETVTKAMTANETRTNQANLKKNQAADAQALMKTCTAATKGLTLDAKTVVDEGIAYLAANDPDLLESLSKRPDFASKMYQLAPALVPAVKQRVTLRRNTILAQKLDQKGDDVPGGGEPSSDDVSAFEAIMASGGEMSDEKLDQMYET